MSSQQTQQKCLRQLRKALVAIQALHEVAANYANDEICESMDAHVMSASMPIFEYAHANFPEVLLLKVTPLERSNPDGRAPYWGNLTNLEVAKHLADNPAFNGRKPYPIMSIETIDNAVYPVYAATDFMGEPALVGDGVHYLSPSQGEWAMLEAEKIVMAAKVHPEMAFYLAKYDDNI